MNKELIKEIIKILKQKGEVDNEKVKQLEAKVEKENKYMWEKKKELDNLNMNNNNQNINEEVYNELSESCDILKNIFNII